VVVVLAVLVELAWPPLLRFDESVDTAIHGWALRTPWAVRVALLLQTAGLLVVSAWVVLATAVVLLVARRWSWALTVVVVAVLAPWITSLIKPVVGRARPVWEQALGSEASLSYPSGHATAGIAVYAMCGLALAGLVRTRTAAVTVAVVFGAFGVATGISRLVLGVHWPSDVVGGFGVATAVAAAVVALLVPPSGSARHD